VDRGEHMISVFVSRRHDNVINRSGAQASGLGRWLGSSHVRCRLGRQRVTNSAVTIGAEAERDALIVLIRV
jgi:hypothetical protein